MTLDSYDVLACGHSAKMQGITIKVFASCSTTEEATEMCFIKEGVKFEDKEKYLGFFSKKLSSGQTTTKKRLYKMQVWQDIQRSLPN